MYFAKVYQDTNVSFQNTEETVWYSTFSDCEGQFNSCSSVKHSPEERGWTQPVPGAAVAVSMGDFSLPKGRLRFKSMS